MTTAVHTHPTAAPRIRRKCACGAPAPALAGSCAECESKKRLQTRLVVGASNDPLEAEADRMAAAALASSSTVLGSAAARGVQRTAAGNAVPEVGAPLSVERVLASTGAPLAPPLRDDMERRFGHSFASVRVHSDSASSASAEEIRAEAYTVGHHIVFRDGRFQPGTDRGRSLLAHELAHVVQQSGEGAIGAPVRRAPAPARRGKILSLAEIAAEPRREKARDLSKQLEAKVCKSIAVEAGKDNCPATLAAGTEVTIIKNKAGGAWLQIAPDTAISGVGPDEPLHVVAAFVQETAAPTGTGSGSGTGTGGGAGTGTGAGTPAPPLATPPAPTSSNAMSDCTSDQADALRNAVSRALSDLDTAIGLLAARPLGDHAKNALQVVYRADDDATAADVSGKLEKIRAGLPTVSFECDQSGDIACIRGDTAFTNTATGVVHLCIEEWDKESDADGKPRIVVHEGAHAFNGASALESYFDDFCGESEDTADVVSTGARLGLADATACIVYHLTHSTAQKVAHDKDVTTGDALTGIKASKQGAVSLSGDAEKPDFQPFEVPKFTDKGRGSGGITGRLANQPEGFAYRWRLFDTDGRHYLLRAYGGDALEWIDFTDQKYAVIGRKTRDLLAKRGVTSGRIECTVKIPGKAEKTVSLDLEFEP